MKLSISLPEQDVAILDEFARSAGLPSRSAAVHHAVRMLRLPELERDYEAAWAEWDATTGSDWDTTNADGIIDAAR